MKKNLYFVLFLGLQFLCGGLYAQSFSEKIKFVQLSTKDGLSQSSIFSITQDYLDLIWVGTRDGLNKYNAHEFFSYRKVLSDSTSLSNNYVTTVFEDNQKQLWIGTGQGVNLYNRDADNFNRISLMPKGQNEPFVYHITQDNSNNLWFSTSAGLYLLRKTKDNQLNTILVFSGQNMPGSKFPGGSGNVQHLYQDSQGRHWLSTSNGVYVFTGLINGKKAELVYDFRLGDDQLNSADVRFSYEMKPGVFWLGTRGGGINVYQEKTKKFTYINNETSQVGFAGLSSDDVRSILQDRNNKGYWIGTINGLNYYQENRGFTSFFKDEKDSYSLADNSIRPIFQDRRGSIWVGTYYGGISIFDQDLAKFQHYEKDGQVEHLSHNVVSGLAKDKNGGFWIGYEGGGLDYMNSSHRILKNYQNNPDDSRSLSNNHVKNIYLDKEDNLWVGTYTGGLNLLRKDRQGFDHYFHNPNDSTSLANNNVYAILQDNAQNLWVGTYGGGLSVKKTNQTSFYARYSSTKSGKYHLNSDEVRSIYLDTRNNLWVGTENGLHVMWSGNDYFTVFLREDKNANSISSNVILSIYEDQKGRLWIGTSAGGINEFRYKSKDFQRFDTEDGLPGNNVVAIAEEKGILWFSTNRGICAFNPDKNEIVNYNLKDGLNGNEFSIGAVCRGGDGELLFGGTHGISSFYPQKISRSTFQPKILFSKFRLHNKLLNAQSPQLANKDISVTKEISLNHDENNISIDFAVLNFITPEKNKYAYRLLGLEETWNYVDVPTATYTNLSPGTYTLQVKGATNDGVWSQEIGELVIIIHSPWWATWWAYSIYSLLFFGLITFFYRAIQARRKLKYALHIQQLEAANNKKMADLKAHFYTHISHELRTPLTLILGPIHQMLTETKVNDPKRSTLEVVKQNAQRLLRLVNELLDSRKTELGLVRLQVQQIDLPQLIHEILFSFDDEIHRRNVHIDFNYPENLSAVWLDERQIEKVFFNLIGNALRYVPINGRIWINIGVISPKDNQANGTIQIEIGDNGPGIPADDLPYIFQLFYQAKNTVSDSYRYGSGMGLALTHDIISLHGGLIQVSSQQKIGNNDSFTQFIIKLPAGLEHFDRAKVDIQNKSASDKQTLTEQAKIYTYIADHPIDYYSENLTDENDENLPLILLIDDNKGILSFLEQQLSKKYRILTAQDGEQGWSIVQSVLPDIVISDVMMPKIDGASLTGLIKRNEATAHIPVILLTALSSEEDMLVGMYAGSDDYLSKPINMELLLVKIQNILFTKQSARRRFIRKYMLKDEEHQEEKLSDDQLFLNRIIEFINNRLSSEDLNVMQLSAELGISRPVLYKRIKQLTGMSIIELINLLRLRRATELFEQGSFGVSEIAYKVGYSDPKWFSKTFKAHYGVTPKQFSEMNAVEKANLIDKQKLFNILQKY